MLASLNHPSVLHLYGVVVDNHHERNVVGIMTEYMRGGSLSAALRCGLLHQLLNLERKGEASPPGLKHAAIFIALELLCVSMIALERLVWGDSSPQVPVFVAASNVHEKERECSSA